MLTDVPGAAALPIARRILRRGRRRVVITVFAPERTGEPPAPWACTCEVTGLDQDHRHRIYGEDSFQALTLALTVIRARLAPVLSELRSFDREGRHLGIPLVLNGDEDELRMIEAQRAAAHAWVTPQLERLAKRPRPRARRAAR